jgi:hypothetical protein
MADQMHNADSQKHAEIAVAAIRFFLDDFPRTEEERALFAHDGTALEQLSSNGLEADRSTTAEIAVEVWRESRAGGE